MQAQNFQNATAILASINEEKLTNNDPLFSLDVIVYGPQEDFSVDSPDQQSGPSHQPPPDLSSDDIIVQNSNTLYKIPEGAVVHAQLGEKKQVSIIVILGVYLIC